MSTIFAKRIRALRKERKKTQNDIAKLLGVLRSTYGEYERANIVPPMDRMKILADYYSVSVDYLIGTSNSPRENNNVQKDISDSMTEIIEYLQNEQSELLFDGQKLDEHSRKLLLTSLENSFKLAKVISRKD